MNREPHTAGGIGLAGRHADVPISLPCAAAGWHGGRPERATGLWTKLWFARLTVAVAGTLASGRPGLHSFLSTFSVLGLTSLQGWTYEVGYFAKVADNGGRGCSAVVRIWTTRIGDSSDIWTLQWPGWALQGELG